VQNVHRVNDEAVPRECENTPGACHRMAASPAPAQNTKEVPDIECRSTFGGGYGPNQV
jgi:hypothetical protein